MGKYDNYSNQKNIEALEKKLEKLQAKREPDLYKIDMIKKELKIARLFESCQIFGREDFWKSEYDPNAKIMFSDDNRVIKFLDKLIHYEDVSSYAFIEAKTSKAYTVTKTKGGITRAVIGGTLAGGLGAIIGAVTAGSKSDTQYYESANGFYLQIWIKDGNSYQCPVPSNGTISNKLPKKWWELGTKLQSIIDEN